MDITESDLDSYPLAVAAAQAAMASVGMWRRLECLINWRWMLIVLLKAWEIGFMEALSALLAPQLSGNLIHTIAVQGNKNIEGVSAQSMGWH